MRTLNTVIKPCLSYAEKNLKLFICIIVACLCGGIFAAVFTFTMPELSTRELLLYLQDFFTTIQETGTDTGTLFRQAVLGNLLSFGLLLFFSLMVFGAPFLVAFSVYGGFSHGFTFFFFIKAYGIRGFLLFLFGMLPHYLLLIPCYLFLLVMSLKNALSFWQEKQNIRKKLPGLLVSYVGFFGLSLCAALLEAYIEPSLIKLIAGLYI